VLAEQQCSTALELLWGVERLPHLRALFDILVTQVAPYRVPRD
jgi:hypothetical protein